ncbi:MAG: hypothetical protein JJE22_19660 [Bacteroidia bacterium]|nr:hypothetical protein [Bacteroidia bacterium]
MQIQLLKNIQFTKLVRADGRLREFNFRKYTGDEGQLLFSVDVVDDRGNRIIFKMKKDDGGWRIVPVPAPLPQWVLSNETTFHDLIEEELGLVI